MSSFATIGQKKPEIKENRTMLVADDDNEKTMNPIGT